MLIFKNKASVTKKFKKGNLDEIQVIFPNVADKSLSQIEEDYDLSKIIDEEIDIVKHDDAIKSYVFIYALLSAKLKRIFSISESTLALTAVSIREKFGINFYSKDGIMTEGNMRKFINKFSKTPEITEEQIDEKVKELKKKDKKIEIDKNQIKEELQIKQDGRKWINLFNNIMKKLMQKIEHPTIHILDCVKIPVNINNDNYELSTVINYEGKATRGYKLGVLRALTEFGGVIEYVIDGTISTNDICLTETSVVNYDGFQPGDVIMMDRGFAKIEFVLNLFKRGLKVIVPVKKNMEIYKECIRIAENTKDENWKKHPTREGQEILLVENLKGIWISEKDRTKKPEKLLKNAIDFSACVIRIEKKKSKNKEVINSVKNAGDETDELYEDEKYLYIVVTTTDTTMSAVDIIKYYELRPEIEEDFRQLKDIWKMCTFTSTRYIFVMAQLVMTILGYNIFNLFKNTKQGEKYINKSIRKIENEEKRLYANFNETYYLILCGNEYAIFNGAELFDLYADCPKEMREKIKPLLY